MNKALAFLTFLPPANRVAKLRFPVAHVCLFTCRPYCRQAPGWHLIEMPSYYHLQQYLRKGNVFTSVSRILSTGGRCTPPRHTPPRQTPHPPPAIAADGAYPTGMHSCLFLVLHSWTVVTRSRMEIPECCRDSGSQEKGSIQQILQQGEERKGKLVRILILILCSLLAPSSCR